MRLKAIFGIAILFLAAVITFTFTNNSYAAGSPLQIAPAKPGVSCPTGIFAGPTTYTFDYNGGTVKLSSASNGSGNIFTDDKVDIEVTHPGGSKSTFSQDYGSTGVIVQTNPQTITNLFRTGANTVKITMTNLRTPQCGASAYWLVETAGGGGGAVKPNVLPRSAWKGDDTGSVTSHTPNRIVVHHTATSNIPGGTGTMLRELKNSILLDPLAAVIGTLDLTQVLNKKGDYASIRGTWPGEIFLAWIDHKFIQANQGYTDIGYHYLVDPNGVIYEGRWKGGLGENADNVGQHTFHANTNGVGIAILGKYGSDGKNTWIDAQDGGIQKPTNASINSVKSLVDWLAGKYNINKTGQVQLPPSVGGVDSCKLSPDQCWVSTIAGHKDFPAKTQTEATACPGDNIYTYLPTLRGTSSTMPGGAMPSYIKPTGILFGGFSPVVLGIVDPTGKRAGIDPATGQYVNNIPGVTHGSFGSLFDTENESTDKSYGIHVPTATNGVYKIDVVGTGTGTFYLGTEDLGSAKARVMKGSTTAGKKDNYQLIFSTTNPSALELFHDTVPPVTTGKMTCSRDMNGTCRSAATVSLTATDTGTNGDPASGVAKIECSYNNQATWEQCGTATGGTLTFSKNEKRSFHYRSLDRVGNVEAAKLSGIIDVQQFVALADTSLTSNLATNLETKGIAQSNGNMSFTYNTTVKLDVINHIGAFTNTGNTTFTYNQKNQITTPNPLPNYPLSYYKTACPNFTGPITIWDTSPSYNKCMYVIGDVTFNATTPTGKLTIVSEGFIKDNSTNANLTAWDTKNGVLFYSSKGYTTLANGATYTGVVYAPTTKIDGAFSNTTLNGGLYSKTVSFGADTSLKAFQAAGFPATTHNLPL